MEYSSAKGCKGEVQQDCGKGVETSSIRLFPKLQPWNTVELQSLGCEVLMFRCSSIFFEILYLLQLRWSLRVLFLTPSRGMMAFW